MGFEFTLENCMVESSYIFCGNKGSLDDAKITLKGSQISNAELFNNLDLTSCCAQLNSREVFGKMTPEEFESIQSILKKSTSKKAFVNALFRHIISFTEGVAASVVANCLQNSF